MSNFLTSIFSTDGFMPHGHCYLWDPALIWTMSVTDILIGLAYISISVSLYLLVKKIRIPFSAIFLAFGLFIGACGATHFMEVITLWHPYYWVAAVIKILTAIASLITALYLVKLSPVIVDLARAAKIADERRLAIEEAYREPLVQSEEFRQILRRSLFLPILLLFALNAVIFWEFKYTLDNTAWVEHSEEVIAQANLVAKLSTSCQTRIRGFVIVGDEASLNLFKEQAARFFDEIKKLQDLVSDNAPQIERVKQMKAEFEQWMVYAQQFVETSKHADKKAVIRQGEKLFEKINDDFDHFLGVETSLVGMRRHRVDTTVSSLIITVISLTILLGLILGYLGREQLLRLSRNYGNALDDLQNKNEVLKKALKSRDEFLSVASHELRTPIMALQLQTRLLKGYATEDKIIANGPRILKVVDTCDLQSNRLAKLIELLLDLTRIRLGKIELSISKVELGEVVRAMVIHVRESKPEYTNHVTISGDAAVEGYWDKSRVEQIVTNLVSNAFKYGKKGDIKIEIAKDPLGQTAILKISDHGIGVDDNLQDKIFERFERAVSGEHISGLGLGLYIVTQLVRAHGGEINLETKVDVGSTFTVKLPVKVPSRTAFESELSKETPSI